jgi:hypothetical protein
MPGSVQCVVTSTPYWALRLYDEPQYVTWADGECCPLGHEQTPEGFVRHSVEVLYRLMPVLAQDASVWWNVMDTFNTGTPIRGSAVEALRAMQGKDARGWGDHDCRRYSAGHAYLKDGEQCLIPAQIALRASRLGYFVKSITTWAKTNTVRDPQGSRASRSLEYIIHLSLVRNPKFDKGAYRALPPNLGAEMRALSATRSQTCGPSRLSRVAMATALSSRLPSRVGASPSLQRRATSSSTRSWVVTTRPSRLSVLAGGS